MGHAQKNCKAGEGKMMSSKCGFCGGPSKCKMKKCKAYNIKCNTCSLFGHYSSCCTDFTKFRARKVRDVTAASAVEDGGEESNNHVRLSNVSKEKISFGTQEEVHNKQLSNVSKEKVSNKSQGKGGDNKVTTNRSGEDDVISEDVKNAKVESTNNHMIRINRVETKQTAMSVVWCPKVGRFIQKASKNYVPLKMEVETLHDVTVDNSNGQVRAPKVPINKANQRKATDNTNCPDTGASITIGGKILMKKLGLTSENLLKDNPTVSAAEGSNIRLLGFIPVTLRVRDGAGGVREACECLYFGDGILNTLVSLTALKNLGCVSRSFPYPDVETASSLTERDDEDYEEDPKEVEPVPREDMPSRPAVLPFPPTEENVPKLRAWLVEQFSKSSFNTSSAPLTKMTGIPMKIHIKDGVDAMAVHKPISIPHHWREQVKKDLERDCDLGIIEKVPNGIPTKWQSRMVVVAILDCHFVGIPFGT